jgi:phosphonate transport system substrate-binding protein
MKYSLLFGLIVFILPHASIAQDCPRRGELDPMYCDANNDMVADTPSATVKPTQLVMGFTAVEDANTLQKTYGGFVDYLKSCTKASIVFLPPQRPAALIQGMREGRIHIGQFSVGLTPLAVNFAGAIPFAAKGSAATNRPDPYRLILIVRTNSPYKTPESLKGKRIAHANETSNSGNYAPRALFPDVGLIPDKDYQVIYSGKHENSILGVAQGLYEGAAVASDVFERDVQKGLVKRNQFRILFESDDFPPDQFSLAHNLDIALQSRIKKCFYDYTWPQAMTALLEGNDKFVPLTYKENWQIIRLITKAAGVPVNKEAYIKLTTTGAK